MNGKQFIKSIGPRWAKLLVSRPMGLARFAWLRWKYSAIQEASGLNFDVETMFDVATLHEEVDRGNAYSVFRTLDLVNKIAPQVKLPVIAFDGSGKPLIHRALAQELSRPDNADIRAVIRIAAKPSAPRGPLRLPQDF
jgi:hypothetical protein